jgi:hypothetical protein
VDEQIVIMDAIEAYMDANGKGILPPELEGGEVE